MHFRIVEDADAEMHKTARYYDDNKEGLGDVFLNELERLLHSIFDAPKLGVLISENIYRRVMKRFPFNILYTTDDSEILIVAIMHHRRLPGYWEGRIK